MPSRRSVAMIRQAISPRLAMRTLSIFPGLPSGPRRGATSEESSVMYGSHPEDAVARLVLGRAKAHVQGESEHVAGLCRLDDAVVPQARCGVVGAPLLLVLRADGRLESCLLLGAPRPAAGLDLVAADCGE